MKNMIPSIVILSGGQDSATCAFVAKQVSDLKAAIYFDYGSQHKLAEYECAKKTALALEIPLITLPGDVLKALTVDQTALTDASKDVSAASVYDPSLPASFVPGRNLYFFLMSAIWGVCNIPLDRTRSGIQLALYTGVCQTDYSGYPDCREVVVDAAAEMVSEGLARNIEILAPLMDLNKAETFRMACELGNHVLYHILEYTHTGYTGARDHRYEWGYGPALEVELDPASLIRQRGWEEFKVEFADEYQEFQLWLEKEGL